MVRTGSDPRPRASPREGTRVATEKAWEAAMNQIAHGMDLEVKPLASVKMTGTGLRPDQTHGGVPGLPGGRRMEGHQSHGGALFRRVASARTVGDAMGSCLEFVNLSLLNYGSRNGRRRRRQFRDEVIHGPEASRTLEAAA